MAAGAVLLAVFVFGGNACRSYHRRPADLPLPYRQAEDAFRLGDNERAARGYRVFLQENPRTELVPRAYYKLALAEFRRGRYTECLAVLDEMERKFPERAWPRVDELRGDVQYRRGYTISALRWWESAWSRAEGELRRKLRARLVDIAGAMPAGELRRALDVLGTDEIRGLVRSRLAAESRRHAKATTPAPVPVQPFPSAPVPTGAPSKIGCLLPLSGPYALYADRLLDGARLAMDGDEDRLLVRDTAGEGATARARLDELIRDPSVIAVVGPLRSRVADAVIPRAERAKLPLLLLSQRAVPPADYVVQPTTTEADQVRELVDYATGILGVRHFGILYPNTAYGRLLARSFQDALAEAGGVVAGMMSYEPDSASFRPQERAVDRWIRSEDARAVFIPDNADRAVPLGRRLRRRHPELVLLGSDGWHGPGLAQAPAALDGAVFVDGFFGQSRRPATQAFVAAYRAAYRKSPDILGAQAYDAVKLVRAALAAGARSRNELLPRLRALRAIDGAAGRIVTEMPGFSRHAFLLELAGGKIREIEDTAPSPAATPSSVPPR